MDEVSKNRDLRECDPLLKNESLNNTKCKDVSEHVKISMAEGNYGTSQEKKNGKAGQGSTDEKDFDDDDATYFKLLSNHPPFRMFILSYLVSHIGEWFTLVGSIATLERLYPNSQTAKSLIFVLRMLPNILFSSIGGALADSMDRKYIMVILDFMGMCTVWLYFLPIVEDKSDELHPKKRTFLVVLLYIAIFVQSTISALYEPARKSIAPMMVPEGNYLKKATTLAGVVWASMTAIGSLLGGIIVSRLGLSACFKIDSLTYLLSAVLMLNVSGNWNASTQSSSSTSSPTECSKNIKEESTMQKKKFTMRYMINSYVTMTKEVYAYMVDSDYKKYSSFIFLKASGCITFGSADILNIDYSRRIEDESEDSIRLGILYSTVGIACLVGPLIADFVTDMDKPRTLKAGCVVSFLMITLGFVGWGLWALRSFHAVVIFTFIRAMGSAVMWIDSTLLIQKYTTAEMLGRVTSLDYLLATIAGSFSTLMTGILQDNLGLGDRGVCVVCMSLGTCVTVYWFFQYFVIHRVD